MFKCFKADFVPPEIDSANYALLRVISVFSISNLDNHVFSCPNRAISGGLVRNQVLQMRFFISVFGLADSLVKS